MADENEVKCRCNEGGRPLWGFCDDDLFCPQCGAEVARLRSPNLQQPDGDSKPEIWIYPQKRPGYAVKQYAFPVSYCYADQNRRRQERAPAVDPEHSLVLNAPPFEPTPKSWGQGKSYHCHLIRKDGSLPAGAAPDEILLPEEGLESQITLVGDFGKRTFDLRICNSPQIEVALEGPGIEEAKRSDPPAGKCWNVVMSDILEIKLVFRAVTAPVLVAEELREIAVVQRDETPPGAADTDVLVEMLDPLPAGKKITPGCPCTSKLKLDTRQFRGVGRKCQLLLRLKTAIVRTPPLVLDLERVGTPPEFWPKLLTAELMYAGEVRSSAPHENVEGPDGPIVIPRLFVRNMGSEKIRLKRPTVKPAADYSIGTWIDVEWAPAQGVQKQGERDGEIELPEGGGEREIYVRVDLRGLGRGEAIPCPSLAATITVIDERGAPWSVEFRITEVHPRKPLLRPLAIDFGNSHSYAAAWSLGEPVRVHDVRDPEHFLTAILFRDLSDPGRPKYVIGPEAATLRSAWPKALVCDLKRWVGDPGKRRLRLVCDERGRSCPMKIDVLVQLYLKAIVQRAEAILREYTVTRIGVSYPARFNFDRLEAFQRLISDFCEKSAQDPELAPLKSAEFDIDEACAVAIGFVFESEVQKKLLPSVVTPQDPTFVVASFDLGGGSLDTALLRFRVKDGRLQVPIYFSSEYLGIGGDDTFGGDNITVATMEILKARIRNKLADPVALDWFSGIPTPFNIDSASWDQYQAYSALWTAAEAIKVFQSRHSPAPDGAEDRPKEARSADDENDRKVFRVQLEAMLVPDKLADAPRIPTVRAALRQALTEGIERDEFLIDLKEIYDHRIECDMWGKKGYKVRDRLEKYVDELCSFAARKKVSIHFTVLGGSGCRLPLVRQVLSEKLPQTRIVYDPDRTKCRVAFGLARYLDVSAGSDHHLARSRDYTSDAIGVRIEGTGQFLQVIPNCSRVNDPDVWYRVETASNDSQDSTTAGASATVGPADGGGGSSTPTAEQERRPFPLGRLPRKVVLYRQEDVPRDNPLGWFWADVSAESPAAPGTAAAAPPDPFPLPKNACAELRLMGSERQIELRIVAGDRIYGPWPMKRGAPPPGR